MVSGAVYTPNLTLLSKMGVNFIPFHPEAETADFLLCRTALESGHVTSPLSYYIAGHPDLGALYIKSGSLTYTAFPSGESLRLSEDCLFLFDCSVSCRIRIHSSAEYEILYFGGHSQAYFRNQLSGEASRTPQPSVPARQSPVPGHQAFLPVQDPPVPGRRLSASGRAGELLFLFSEKEADPVLCHTALTVLLAQAVAENALPRRNAPAYLSALKAELESKYYRKYTLEGLSQKYRVDKYRICREFKNCFQVSPLQYLHGVRIQSAKDLLIKTDLKIHEIGYEVGYENVNHFISHFKKITGMTPKEYRNNTL